MFRHVMLCLLVIVSLSTGTASAQQQEHMGHGAGTPADNATTESAAAFIDMFVQMVNAGDPSAANLTTEAGWIYFFQTPDYFEAQAKLQNGEVSPLTIHETGNALVHEDGAVSVEVLYSGYLPVYTNIYTERWYLLPDGVGGFVLDTTDWYVPVRVPAGMTSAEVTLTISADAVTVNPQEVQAVDALRIDVINTQPNAWGTTGIYVLPPEVMPMEAQAQILASWNAGQQIPYRTITITPREPGETRASIVQMEPGETLLVQQWSLDATGQNPQPLEGEMRVATVTISTDPLSTPAD